MPWDQLHMPHGTGITVARLVTLGILIVLFRRIPAIMLGYRLMPKVCFDWKEALFMGYFAPIGKFKLVFEFQNVADGVCSRYWSNFLR